MTGSGVRVYAALQGRPCKRIGGGLVWRRLGLGFMGSAEYTRKLLIFTPEPSATQPVVHGYGRVAPAERVGVPRSTHGVCGQH